MSEICCIVLSSPWRLNRLQIETSQMSHQKMLEARNGSGSICGKKNNECFIRPNYFLLAFTSSAGIALKYICIHILACTVIQV